jgi:hypothetical protein
LIFRLDPERKKARCRQDRVLANPDSAISYVDSE